MVSETLNKIPNQYHEAENNFRKILLQIYPGILPRFAQAFHNSGNMIEQRLSFLLQSQKTLQLIGFWGVGEKISPDEQDFLFLDELQEIQQSITEIYPSGVDIHLILADIHGEFNGFSHSRYYLTRVQEALNPLGMHSIFLSDLYQSWKLEQPMQSNQIDPSLPVYQDFWAQIKYRRQREQMIESASRHARQNLNPEFSAFYYAHMRNQEKQFLAKTFPDAILMVNGSKSLGMVTLPKDIPHMYLKTGPVWFTAD